MRFENRAVTWSACVLLLLAGGAVGAGEDRLILAGRDGAGEGKHIVFVTGDEEYRSEESMPQLAKILAVRHGFNSTVLFAINRKDGTIDPEQADNIPGLETLDTADLMVIFTRFRDLPPEQMRHIVDYVESGKPVLGLRTATHAFAFRKHKDSPYAKYGWDYRGKEYEWGFGRQVLGETWRSHYGHHQVESTRGLVAKGAEDHPIVRGCEDIWGPSDVYGLEGLEGDAKPIVMGQVLVGMNPGDKPHPTKGLVPVAWTKTYAGAGGKAARVFTTTMGHGGDLKSEGFRRLLVNACYFCLGMEEKIPARAQVDLVGAYDPNPIGTGKHKRGLRPSDHKL